MSEVKKTLEMTRGGEFDIHTYGDNHCGIAEEFKIRYHLKCRCSPKLDNRGFLFDQLNVQSYFDSIKRTKLSCEQLTVRCLEQLLEHILVENPSCQIYGMELTLSPAPFMASMTHAWDNPDDPLKNPEKTKKVVSKKTATAFKSLRKSSKQTSIRFSAIADGSEASQMVPDQHPHLPSHNHYKFHEDSTDTH